MMTVIITLLLGLTVFYVLPWLHAKYGEKIPEVIAPLVTKIVGLLKFGAKVAITACLIILAYWIIPPVIKNVERVVGDELCLDNSVGNSDVILSHLNDKVTGSWRVNTFANNTYCHWHLGLATNKYKVHGWNLQYPAEKYTDPHARFMVYSLNREIVYSSDIGVADREYLKDYLMVSEKGQMRASNMALRVFAYWYREDEEHGANRIFINGEDVTEMALEALSIDADRDDIPNDQDEKQLDHRRNVEGFEGQLPIKLMSRQVTSPT